MEARILSLERAHKEKDIKINLLKQSLKKGTGEEHVIQEKYTELKKRASVLETEHDSALEKLEKLESEVEDLKVKLEEESKKTVATQKSLEYYRTQNGILKRQVNETARSSRPAFNP